MSAVLRVDLIDMTLFILILVAGFMFLSPIVFSAFFRAKEEHIMRMAARITRNAILKGNDDGKGS